jgi:hypothetical protein
MESEEWRVINSELASLLPSAVRIANDLSAEAE